MKGLIAVSMLFSVVFAAPFAGMAAVAGSVTTQSATCAPDDETCTEEPTDQATDDTSQVQPAAGAPQRVASAIRTAMSLVGARSGWYHKCDKLACRMYGYGNSGHATANVHWYRMLATGHAHPGNRCPPAGAFVFWATGGSAGHVAFVAANDGTCQPGGIKVVTNDWGDRRSGAFGGVYLTTLSGIEDGWMSRSGYRGWTDPICAGALLG